MRAAIYVRMSTDQQENSPERQRSQILPYCKSKGYQIVARYEDLGMRGTDDSRPQFQKLLRDAKEGLFDVVVVDEQSRLTRSDPVEFISTVIGPLRSAGVVLDTVAKGIVDWNDLGQFLVGSITQHTSNAEVQNLSRRVVTELARKAPNADLVAGKAPYGYRQAWKDAEGKIVHEGNSTWTKRPEGWKPTLVVSETEAEVVKQIFRAYTEEGKSLCEISRDLHSQGTLSPNGKEHWPRSGIRHLLKNRVYLGEFVYNRVTVGNFYQIGWVGEDTNRAVVAIQKKQARGNKGSKTVKNSEDAWVIIPGHHTPLVSKDLFDRTQTALSKNKRNCAPTAYRAEYALSGLLFCKKCGSTMIGDRDRDTKIYLCSGYATNGLKHCNPYRVREVNILILLEQCIANEYLSPKRLATVRQVAEELKENKRNDKEISLLKKSITDLEGKVKKAEQNILLLDSDLVKGAQEQIRRWKGERKAARDQLDLLEKTDPVEDVEVKVSHMRAALLRMQEAKASGNLSAFRKVARAYFERIELEYRSEQKSVKQRHRLVGGVIHCLSGEVIAFTVQQGS